VYGVGGPPGAPVLFLHGWGLGSHAYKRAIRRLTRRGCRVYAPALPSFGGTADLPPGEANIGGYARWVAAFMQGVGIEDPALVVGHSFGGGVAIKVAHAHPDRVSYLVLLNAVGGVTPRPPWAWAVGFARELWPPRQAVETVDAMRGDLVRNLLRNPGGLARAGLLAAAADLRVELNELRERGLPVLALTSDADGVIPRTGFDAVCEAVGTDGHVVNGRHTWLLADPDAFDAVVASVVDVQVREHRDATASGRAAGVVDLLDGAMPRRTARALVADASPLWLLSDDAGALAGDLALCRPNLRAGEVRAVARPVEGTNAVRLTVVTHDRAGLLADSATVLAANGLSIRNASASTWSGRGLALHAFTVDVGTAGGAPDWDGLGADLRRMVLDGVEPLPFRGRGRVEVVVDGDGGDRTLVRVRARDQVGLLAAICRWFATNGVSVETLHARTVGLVASDQFLVNGPVDGPALEYALSPASR
jgi:pimeloyl-ACP methyl ester carboxylesterase/glycine cleavage system regulatory protein